MIFLSEEEAFRPQLATPRGLCGPHRKRQGRDWNGDHPAEPAAGFWDGGTFGREKRLPRCHRLIKMSFGFDGWLPDFGMLDGNNASRADQIEIKRDAPRHQARRSHAPFPVLKINDPRFMQLFECSRQV